MTRRNTAIVTPLWIELIEKVGSLGVSVQIECGDPAKALSIKFYWYGVKRTILEGAKQGHENFVRLAELARDIIATHNGDETFVTIHHRSFDWKEQVLSNALKGHRQ